MAESARSRYNQLARHRDPFLDTAREAARLTIPGLVPPEGHYQGQQLYQPYQGFGSRCVLNLASKIMMAMYPPGLSSFRLDIPSEVAGDDLETDSDLERYLSLVEKRISKEIERKQWRMPTMLSLLYLVVGGNSLEQMLPNNRIRTFRLDQYVVVREVDGDETEIIVQEMVERNQLPPELEALADGNRQESTVRLPLFTWARRQKDGTWKIHQEFNDQIVPGSEGEYRVSPFKPLRWTVVDGEAYGRGKVEDHMGDFRQLEGLAKAMKDGSTMAARNVIVVSPNAAGGTNVRRRVAEANNGDVIIADPNDVSMLQFDNVQGMQIAQSELGVLRNELGTVFLLNSAARRDAERVTATELRMMVEEIEGVLGGAYSMLAQDLQAHRLRRLILQMQGAQQLPDWPDGMVEPTILTGLEALGREQDVQRVGTGMQFLAGLPPEALDYIKWDSLLTKAFNGLHLPDAIRSEEEAMQIRQQRMMQQMGEQLGQAGAQALAKSATQ